MAAASSRTLLEGAAEGRLDCLGQLLEQYRNYLYLMARTQLQGRLQVRTSPSDIVQETFLQACRRFTEFRGATEAEFAGWLRQILASALVAAYEKHVQAQKRSVRREGSVDLLRQQLDRSSLQFEQALASQLTGPQEQVERHELALLVADRLMQLPPELREVILLRNMQGLSLNEVARRIEKHPTTTKRLWAEAIQQLSLPTRKVHDDG